MLLTILTASPAQFQSTTLLTNYSQQLLLAGDPGATYCVQISTNLANWTALTNIILTSGASAFDIGSLTNDAQRFFRARSGP